MKSGEQNPTRTLVTWPKLTSTEGQKDARQPADRTEDPSRKPQAACRSSTSSWSHQPQSEPQASPLPTAPSRLEEPATSPETAYCVRLPNKSPMQGNAQNPQTERMSRKKGSRAELLRIMGVKRERMLKKERKRHRQQERNNPRARLIRLVAPDSGKENDIGRRPR